MSRSPSRRSARRGFGGSRSAPAKPQQLATITLNTLPIANGCPLDLGIKKGFFRAQGIEISKRTLQSGNDIVLALSNHNGDIGYVGWVPAMIARTQGIPLRRSPRATSRGRTVPTTGRTSSSRATARSARPPISREDDRRQRAQGRRRGDDQGGAEEARRQPGLDPAPRAAVPDHAQRRSATGRSTRSGRPSRS